MRNLQQLELRVWDGSLQAVQHMHPQRLTLLWVSVLYLQVNSEHCPWVATSLGLWAGIMHASRLQQDYNK